MTAMLPSRPPGEDHASPAGEVVDPDTVALREFNALVVTDDRVEVVMLSIGDGVTLVRRR